MPSLTCRKHRSTYNILNIYTITYLTVVRQLLLLVQKGFLSAKVVHKLPLQNDTSSKEQGKKFKEKLN